MKSLKLGTLISLTLLGLTVSWCAWMYSPTRYRNAIEKLGIDRVRDEAQALVDDFRQRHPDTGKEMPGEAVPLEKLPAAIGGIPSVVGAHVNWNCVYLRLPGPDLTQLVILSKDEKAPDVSGEFIEKVVEGIYLEQNP